MLSQGAAGESFGHARAGNDGDDLRPAAPGSYAA